MKKGFFRWIGKSTVEILYSDFFKDSIKYISITCLIPIVIIGLLVLLTGVELLIYVLVPIMFILTGLYIAYDKYEPKTYK